MKKNILFSIFILTLPACVVTQIDKAVTQYHSVKSEIRLGMSLSDFISLIELYQNKLDNYSKKPSKRYTKDGVIFDIYYIRTSRIPDGETTDDEFTPHLFKDGKLAEIGWESIEKMDRTSYDVAREKAEIQKAKATATKINQTIKQSTNVNNSQYQGIDVFP